MATPIGHSLFGLLLARRLGVRSRFGMTTTVLAASLPDIDIPMGVLLHRDPWKWHRQGTHTLGFALTAGALAGLAGIVSAGSAEGERDLIADALTGAAVVGSHIVLDKMWFPYVNARKGRAAKTLIGVQAINWAIDALVYGALTLALWPERER